MKKEKLYQAVLLLCGCRRFWTRKQWHDRAEGEPPSGITPLWDDVLSRVGGLEERQSRNCV